MKERRTEIEVTRHEFTERADEVSALDGQLLLLPNGVEIHFPGRREKRFYFRDGVEPLDDYIDQWKDLYFDEIIGMALA